MTTQVPLAQLVHPGTSLRHYVVWGFPLAYDVLDEAVYKRTGQTPDEREENGNFFATQDLCQELEEECFEVVQGVFTQVQSKLVCSRKGEKLVLGIVHCTRPDKRRLPSPDKVEGLKKVLAKHGFTEEAAWFVKLNM